MGIIEQTVTENVAAVDWNDDRDVVLTIWTKRRHVRQRVLTRSQARELAADLIAVVETAESASGERTRPDSAGFDRIGYRSPDCVEGKHRACLGEAWSLAEDAPAVCVCACHDKEAAA